MSKKEILNMRIQNGFEEVFVSLNIQVMIT